MDIMISIRPEWVEEITAGRKTTEVRKTRPKQEPPFRCLIYRTNGGGVVGEFICNRIVTLSASYKDIERANRGFSFYEQTRLTDRQIIDYLGNGATGFGWCISKLKIYDKPRPITDFCIHPDRSVNNWKLPLKRPPQSWCYVDEMKLLGRGADNGKT